jgi:hypothetical protein
MKIWTESDRILERVNKVCGIKNDIRLTDALDSQQQSLNLTIRKPLISNDM